MHDLLQFYTAAETLVELFGTLPKLSIDSSAQEIALNFALMHLRFYWLQK